MTKRQKKQKTHTPSARATSKKTDRSRIESAKRTEKPTKRSRSTGGSEPVQSAAQISGKRLRQFEKFAAGLGLAQLSDSNRVLTFSGEPFVPDALKALPQLKREFTICCEYRLLMPVAVPFACAFAPEASSDEDVFPRRRVLFVNFGMAGKSYAYVRHEGVGHLPGLAVCLAVDAVVLFQEWLGALQMATWSVNSSPMSPEYFDITPKECDFDDPSLTTILKALRIADA